MHIIKQLAEINSFAVAEVQRFLLNAPLKYKHYSIPKRSGGRRLIAQPTPKLKSIQRSFLLLINFPMHSSAMAYRAGLSIKDNAVVHKNSRYLLGMDLRDFFNSITPDIFWAMCDKRSVLQEVGPLEKELISRLLFWSPSKNLSRKWILSVGAPSSPTISNFVMYDFDVKLSDYCKDNSISYTRYADDLSFSTNLKDTLFDVPEVVKSLLSEFFGNALLVNHKKTIFSSKAHNRHITGITINNNAELSLGRERKRYIKGLIFRYKNDQLSKEEYDHMRGLLAFALHIEPDFIIRLNSKYGDSIVNKIMKSVTYEQ